MWKRAEPTRATWTRPSAEAIQCGSDHACGPAGFEREPHPNPLADELAHVFQRRAANGSSATPPAGAGVPASARRAVRGADQPLGPAIRAMMEPLFGADFGDVRVHTDGASTRDAAALAYTIGSDVVFAPGRYQPDNGPGLRLLAHELTHVVQQRRGTVGVQAREPGSSGLDPAEREAETMAGRIGPPHGRLTGGTLSHQEATEYSECLRIMRPSGREFCDREVLGQLPPVVPDVSLGNRPLAERLELKVHRVTLDAGWAAAVEGFFGAAPAAARPVPVGCQVVLGTSVIPQFSKGIQAVGALLLDQISLAKPPADPILPPNHTFNIAIHATGHVFRFTRLGTSTLMIEQLGTIMTGPAAVPDADAKPGTFVVAKRSFSRGSGWRTNDAARLEAALAAMPPGLLPPAGTLFKREPVNVCTDKEIAAGTCDPEWAGMHRYDKGHTVTLFDRAFVENARRDGTWPALYTIIAHEIGHARDYEPLRQAMAMFSSPKTIKSTEERKKAIQGIRSPSGRRFKQAGKTSVMINFDVDENAASRLGEYRVAALADGLQADPAGKLSHGLTAYSEEKWSENFAENFSIYAADPELLRLLRPNVFAYFQRAFSR